MIHNFNTEIASQFGINSAVILEHFSEIFKNRGGFSYPTVKNIQKSLPFISEYSIRRSLLILKKNGYISSSNISPNPLDRTISYSLTMKALEVVS